MNRKPDQEPGGEEPAAGAKSKLLIVEDDVGLQRQLAWTFEDYEVLFAADRQSTVSAITSAEIPVVTLDLGLPPAANSATEGLATLERLRTLSPHSKVIVVTGRDEREYALKAIDLGAYDFYQKPIDADTIRLIVGRAHHLYALEAENRRLQKLATRSSLPGLITASPPMLGVCAMVEKVASSSVSVMLFGESGTGKELVARALHDLSPRAAKRFVAINCAAIPEPLLESELFGHEKGAYTGAHRQVVGKIELADRGTLFLDEIGDMPMPLQAKLLRFVQERVLERIGGRSEISVDARIICATHQDPGELIRTNRLREDLYYRLSGLVINIPPLRQRPGDPVLLAHHFLNMANQQSGRAVKKFTPDAIAALVGYQWPGNVRELENYVKRAVIMADGAQVTAAELALPAEGAGSRPPTLKEVREKVERDAVQLALARCSGNVTQAARLLDVSRPTLYDLMRQHKISS